MIMKVLPILALGAAALTPVVFLQATVLEPADLQKIVEGMGYTTKMLNEEKGKEKFEFTIKAEGFDVPIAAEVSPSKNYVWFTVLLGKATEDGAKNTALIKENFKIQPDFFYATEKGNLMMGIAVDNRGVNAAVVKRVTDKLAEDVSKTSKVWQ
jgi:hypothetical protein